MLFGPYDGGRKEKMELRKIGKFIASERKAKDITQEKLAEMLDVSDRAVSKWERGICMPSTAVMANLCEILDFSINELFCGERIDMNSATKQLEKNLLEMAKMKEQRDKELLTLEIFIGVTVSLTMLSCILLAAFVDMPNWVRAVLITIGIIPFAVGVLYALRIEQIAGYYKCEKCGHKYIPKYLTVLFAMHVNRTRYMKCPKCGKKSWQKKIIR
jgi:transcriptional regulator with XRE-family HTH domain/DNA-directed RNA polymerase subunit RPC12/RpoP